MFYWRTLVRSLLAGHGSVIGSDRGRQVWVQDGKVFRVSRSGVARLGDYFLFMDAVRRGQRPNFTREPLWLIASVGST